MAIRIFARLRRIPAWTIGSVYLLLIPGFAFAYRAIWEDFYQATARYEPATWALDIDSRREIQSLLRRWFRAHSSMGLQFEHVEVTNLSVQDGQFIFISPVVFSVNSTELERSILMGYAFIVRPDGPDAGKLTVTFRPRWSVNIESEEIVMSSMPSALYRDPHVRRSLDIMCRKMEIIEVPPRDEVAVSCLSFDWPERLKRLVSTLGRAAEGFPGPERGSFLRFFYFSTVTITTLGFGDIVPMTNRARLLVSFEAILGIVLAGTFLNSIAGSIRSAPNLGNSSGRLRLHQ